MSDDGGRVRVLVVEDEAVIRLGIEDQLLRAGLEPVALAQDHASALRATAETEFDVVLMDVNLGAGPDGIETAAAILARVDVPIIFLTAYGSAEVVRRAMEVAPYGYLLKPFDDGLLQITIRLAIARHRADVELRSLAAAVDQAPVGVLVVDARTDERRVRYANREFARMSGASSMEVLGRVPCFLAADPEAPEVRRLRAALERGQGASEVVEGRGADGEFVSSVTVTPVHSPQGVMDQLVVVHADVTALREAQNVAAARERSELVGRLAAGVAHDFNNLLSVILSYASLARDGDDVPEEARRDLDAISAAAERGGELTSRLLALSRPGAEPGHGGVIDCISACRQSVESLRQVLGLGGQVRFELPPGPLFVPIDLESFQQILLHVAAHARDAVPAGGALEVSMRVFPERVRLTVRRAGAPSIVGATTKVAARDTDLWTARVLAERCGGEVSVLSASGEGSAFTLALPLVTSPAEVAQDPSEAWSDVRVDGTCLVVDDDPSLAAAYARALTRVGLDVSVTHSLDAALRDVDRLGDALDYLVTDLDLDGKSGALLVEHVLDVAPRARAVVVSGYVDADVALPAEAAVLWKPFSLETLTRAVILSRASKEPVVTTSPVASSPSSHPPLLAPDARVLLLDEDYAVREGVASLLRRRNVEVVEAASVQSALAHVEREAFDALLVDLRPPEASALAVVEAARRRDPDVSALVLSAEPSRELTRLALQHRATGFLGKPVSPEELWSEVERALSNTRVGRLQRKLMRVSSEAMTFLGDIPASGRLLDASLDELHVAYQPIVRAFDSDVHAYEALVRSRGPLANPARLIAAAEALGRMDELGRAIRARIAKDLERAPEHRHDIFVNLHPTEFDDRLVASDEPLLPHASRVVFEVTERAQLRSEAETLRTLDALRAAGFRVALDDLGEGYAGLNWISKLGPDVIKLDMTLVRDVQASPIKRDIIAAVVGLCRRARILVVAEGVETQAEAATLRALGCDLLQGYLFARPGPPFPRVDPRVEGSSAPA